MFGKVENLKNKINSPTFNSLSLPRGFQLILRALEKNQLS
jgi:hypothetical protein